MLFLPSHEFLEKLFMNAAKPRILQSLCKAYLHHSFRADDTVQKLWETVVYGLKEYEHNKCRPFFTLFQVLMESAQESKFVEVHSEALLTEFFRKLIGQNMRYFQWMEYAIDFVWKMYTRVPFVRAWMQQNIEAWTFLSDWLDKNKEPPLQYQHGGVGQQQNVYRMNKTRNGVLNGQRFNKQLNQVLFYFRQTCLNHMKNKSDIDLSHEVDFDAVDVQDFKLVTGMKVDIMECKFAPHVNQATIMTDLDEIVSVRITQDDGQDQISWILAQKCKIFCHGLYQTTHRFKDMLRISDVIQKRAEIEAAQRAK